MLSSTSNSKQNNKSWLLTWILTGLILFISLGSYELFLKNRDFVASIKDSKDLWSWYRGNIYHKKQLVIIGASRSQIDINLDYLHKKYPDYNIVQLSINGQYPMATLRALAHDERFNGVVVVSINAQALETQYLEMQKENNDYFLKGSTYYKALDAYLTAQIKIKFRFFHPLLGLEQIVKNYQNNKAFIDVFYTSFNADRGAMTDYKKTDTTALLKHFVKGKRQNYINVPPSKPYEIGVNIKKVVNYVGSIEKRGGKVFLVRFPTDKGHWQLDEEYYPRSKYWDELAKEPCLRTIHFEDVSGLAQFDLPDSSHLNSRDSQAFTEILFNDIQVQ